MTALVRLTRPDGKDVWINTDAIVSVSESAEEIGRTTINLTSGFQLVQEKPAEIIHHLTQHLQESRA